MFSRMPTREIYERLLGAEMTACARARCADAVVIGAGAGLSHRGRICLRTGERFEQYFSDFAAKYDFHDMYPAGSIRIRR